LLEVTMIKHSIFGLFLLLVLPLFAVCASVDLTHVTLSQQLGQHKTMVVMFYAPWCSHSKEALPVWQELADSMQGSSSDKDIFVGKIDCVAEPDAYWEHNITSFPTIKVFVNYNTIPIVYDGERIANTMWRYLRIMHRQYVEEITTMDQFSDFQERKLTYQRPLALALLPPTTSSADNKVTGFNDILNNKIDGACKKADRVACVITRSPAIASELGLTVPSVALFTLTTAAAAAAAAGGAYPSIEAPLLHTTLDTTSSLDIADWLTMHSFPPLLELTEDNSDLIFSQARPGFQNHFIFLLRDAATVAEQQEREQELEVLRKVGRYFQGRAVVLYVKMGKGLTEYAQSVLTSLRVDVAAENIATLSSARAVRSQTSAMRFYMAAGSTLCSVDIAGVEASDSVVVQVDATTLQERKVREWMEAVLTDKETPTHTTSH
jgi:thiol-disulfide isomerase/thioredoxin